MMTRLPTPEVPSWSADLPTRASRYYPVAGYAVGAISGTVFWTASIALTPYLAAILAVGASAIATGALHEDGLADTVDGLWGGTTPARRLEIMKDSRIGTFGALALLLLTALRIAALAALKPETGFYVLLVCHSVARAAPLITMRTGLYAGDPATAKLPHTDMRISNTELASGWAIALVALSLAEIDFAVPCVLASAAIAVAVQRRTQALAGGFTGDVLGCIEQVVEATILLIACWAYSPR